MEQSPEQEEQALKDMLPQEKLAAYTFYVVLIGNLLFGAAQHVLKESLRRAYIQSFSISCTKPYGATSEFAPAIKRIKDLIDEIEDFMSYTTDGRRRSRQLKMWQEEPGRRLHALLCERLNDAETLEALAAWLAVGKDMTGRMSSLTAATRGSGPGALAEDDDLRALQGDLCRIASHSADPAECLVSLRDEFGEAD